MIELRILSVGRSKEKYWNAAVAEYAKRLSRYCKLSFAEVQDEKTPDQASAAECRQIKELEGSRQLKQIREKDEPEIWDEFWKNRRKMMYIRQNPEAKTPAEAPPSDDFLCIGLSLIFGVGMCLAANLFVSLLKLGGSEVSAAASSGRTYGVLYEIQNSVLFQIVSVVIVAATVEELLFRGVIFRRLLSGGGIFFPVLISSMIYASFYGTAAGFVFGFLVAIGAAYLYYRTRNLKTPVFYHIFLNAMTLVFTLLGAHTNAFFGSTRRVVLAFLIGLVLLAFAIIFIEYYLPKVPKEPEKGEK